MFKSKYIRDIFNFFLLVLLIIIAVNNYLYDGFHLNFNINKQLTLYRDLYEDFDSAALEGNLLTKDIPWGSTIAKIPIEKDNKEDSLYNRKAVLSHPYSQISYKIHSDNDKHNFVFDTYAGIHPVAQNWGSDGVNVKVDVIDGTNIKTIYNGVIMPKDGFKHITCNISGIKEQDFVINLTVSNEDGKNAVGDWLIWIDPKLLIK